MWDMERKIVTDEWQQMSCCHDMVIYRWKKSLQFFWERILC